MTIGNHVPAAQSGPLFEVIDQMTGATWRLFEDGRTDGFPTNAIVINRALPLLNALRTKQQIPRIKTTDE